MKKKRIIRKKWSSHFHQFVDFVDKCRENSSPTRLLVRTIQGNLIDVPGPLCRRYQTGKDLFLAAMDDSTLTWL